MKSAIWKLPLRETGSSDLKMGLYLCQSTAEGQVWAGHCGQGAHSMAMPQETQPWSSGDMPTRWREMCLVTFTETGGTHDKRRTCTRMFC